MDIDWWANVSEEDDDEEKQNTLTVERPEGTPAPKIVYSVLSGAADRLWDTEILDAGEEGGTEAVVEVCTAAAPRSSLRLTLHSTGFDVFPANDDDDDDCLADDSTDEDEGAAGDSSDEGEGEKRGAAADPSDGESKKRGREDSEEEEDDDESAKKRSRKDSDK